MSKLLRLILCFSKECIYYCWIHTTQNSSSEACINECTLIIRKISVFKAVTIPLLFSKSIGEHLCLVITSSILLPTLKFQVMSLITAIDISFVINKPYPILFAIFVELSVLLLPYLHIELPLTWRFHGVMVSTVDSESRTTTVSLNKIK